MSELTNDRKEFARQLVRDHLSKPEEFVADDARRVKRVNDAIDRIRTECGWALEEMIELSGGPQGRDFTPEESGVFNALTQARAKLAGVEL